MLVGREAEQRSLGQLLSAARVGRSGVLVLTGAAGIGKTTLLDHVAREAQGMRVLRAVGSASEQEVAFGGLLQLLRPILGLLDQLPGPQTEALAAALALREGKPGDRFAIGAATLSLLSRSADDRPLLLVLDDAPEIDEPSLEAVVFAARRMVTDQVAVLAAGRPAGVLAGPLSALPRLELGGLELADATRLLTLHARGPTSAELVVRLHAATTGNPLALLELAADAELLESLAPEVPVPVPEVLAGAFRRRVTQLDEEVRLALLVAALSGGDLVVATEAATALGADIGGLGAAQDAGLVSVSAGSVVFRHPLVRSSIYAATPTDVRRAAHRAVARSLPPTDLERRTWHLAEAAVGFDDGLADALDLVAGRARNRRAFAVASTAQERAALLSSERARRAVRLVAAGESAWWAGQIDRALALLDRGAGITEDVTLRATADGLRGSIASHTGSVGEARDILVRAAHQVAELEPDTAVRLLADGIEACFWMSDVPRAVELSADLANIATRARTGESRVVADLAIGMTDVLAGRSGIEVIRRAVDRLEDPVLWPDDPLRIQLYMMGVLFVRERGAGGQILSRVEANLRSRASLGALPGLLFHMARGEATSDGWQSAVTRYDESIALSRETRQSTLLAMSLAGLAWLHARRGSEVTCREMVAEAQDLAARHDVRTAAIWSSYALGDLHLGLGKVEAALHHYEELVELLEGTHNLDVDLVPGPELVECLLRLDRLAEARAQAEDYHARAAAKGQTWARARAERAMAMVAAPDEAEQRFDAALELQRLSPDVFEEARTQLTYSASLRRGRRRVAARPLLRAALATFERIGAEPWAELAAQELAATGETPHRRGSAPTRLLTGQELQISRMLAAGRTTRETAAALFLSPKTVEYHLRHVYTKLDIHSRAELAAALGEEAAEA